MTLGARITWRRGTGQVVRGTVDLVHEVDGERWLFVSGKQGEWAAVKSTAVRGVVER